MSTTKLPSTAAMAARANDGHHKALLRIEAGEPLLPPNYTAGMWRGMRTVRETLVRWEAIEVRRTSASEYEHLLTDRGRDLLAELNARSARR